MANISLFFSVSGQKNALFKVEKMIQEERKKGYFHAGNDLSAGIVQVIFNLLKRQIERSDTEIWKILN